MPAPAPTRAHDASDEDDDDVSADEPGNHGAERDAARAVYDDARAVDDDLLQPCLGYRPPLSTPAQQYPFAQHGLGDPPLPWQVTLAGPTVLLRATNCRSKQLEYFLTMRSETRPMMTSRIGRTDRAPKKKLPCTPA